MPNATYEALDFAEVADWYRASGQLEALSAFGDCQHLFIDPPDDTKVAAPDRAESLAKFCQEARLLAESEPSEQAARHFFEQRFRPHRVIHGEGNGLLTGYYEPVLKASRTKSAKFKYPLLRRPADLVDLTAQLQLDVGGQNLTHARLNGTQLEPFPVRSAIETGVLDDQSLQFAYLDDPVDAFFLHIQGSGILEFASNERIRLGYDGKNGHPYTSIGKQAIEQGWIPADEMDLARLGSWLRSEPERGRELMWANESFVFFKELGPESEVRPTGVYDTPLTAGSSLAVDQAFHQIGLPVFVTSKDLGHSPWCSERFHRLMIAQDVGSAIVGPERGDIFFGSGDSAGLAAGQTKNCGNLFVLLPREVRVP
ncbi:MAG: MltA domain-containing protein [Pseudomonadota bacterium]